jgi:hypothetical protein
VQLGTDSSRIRKFVFLLYTAKNTDPFCIFMQMHLPSVPVVRSKFLDAVCVALIVHRGLAYLAELILVAADIY